MALKPTGRQGCLAYRQARIFGLPAYPLVAATGLTAVMALTICLFDAFGDGVWNEEARRRAKSYCEARRKGEALGTRANSWSNLAYVSAGGWALGLAAEGSVRGAERDVKKDTLLVSAEPLILPPSLLIAIGLSTLCLAVGSFLFHAALTRLGNQLDVGAMYWVMNAALAANAWRWLRLSAPSTVSGSRWIVALLLLLVSMCDAVMMALKWKLHSAIVFNSQLGIVIMSEALITLRLPSGTRSWHMLLCCVAIMMASVALVFRQLGIKAKKDGSGFCDPGSMFQPHAVWHVLTGSALLALHELQAGGSKQRTPHVSGAPVGDGAEARAKESGLDISKETEDVSTGEKASAPSALEEGPPRRVEERDTACGAAWCGGR
jgi:hypothetical protein